jgi:hypothetical protein
MVFGLELLPNQPVFFAGAFFFESSYCARRR